MTRLPSTPTSKGAAGRAAAALLVVGVVVATPVAAGAQTQREAQAPSELWKTYPIDPHRGRAPIQSGNEADVTRPPQRPSVGGRDSAPTFRPDAPAQRPNVVSPEPVTNSSSAGVLAIALFVIPVALLLVVLFVPALAGPLASMPRPRTGLGSALASRVDRGAGSARRARPHGVLAEWTASLPRPRARAAETRPPPQKPLPLSPSGARLVDYLVEAAMPSADRAQERDRRLEGGAPQAGPPQAEVEALKAKSAATGRPKGIEAGERADAEVLKRKTAAPRGPEAPDTEAPAGKTGGKETMRSTERAVLREKLASADGSDPRMQRHARKGPRRTVGSGPTSPSRHRHEEGEHDDDRTA